MNWFKPSGPCSCGCVQPPCTCPGTRRYLVLDLLDFDQLTEEGPHDINTFDISWPLNGGNRYFTVYWTYPISLSIELPEMTCLYDGIVRYSYPGAEIPSGLPQSPYLGNRSPEGTNRGSTDIPGGGVLVEEYDDFERTTQINSTQFDMQLRSFWEPSISDGYICRQIILDWVAGISGGISNDLPRQFSNPDPGNIYLGLIAVNRQSSVSVSALNLFETEWLEGDAKFDNCGPIRIKNANQDSPLTGRDPSYFQLWPSMDRLQGDTGPFNSGAYSRYYKWSIFQQ